MGMKNNHVPIITSFGNQLFLPNCYGVDSEIAATASLKCNNSDLEDSENNNQCTSSSISGLVQVQDKIVDVLESNLLIQVTAIGMNDMKGYQMA